MGVFLGERPHHATAKGRQRRDLRNIDCPWVFGIASGVTADKGVPSGLTPSSSTPKLLVGPNDVRHSALAAGVTLRTSAKLTISASPQR